MIRSVADPEFLDESGDFDHSLVRPETISGAKRLVRTKVTKKMGPSILQKGGPVAFFDAVAVLCDNGDDLKVLVDEMLVYAFLHQWSFSEHPARLSRLLEDAGYYMERLDEAVYAFCAVAPALVLSADQVTVGRTGSVSISSYPDYYNYSGS
jgi:hypothetical protein